MKTTVIHGADLLEFQLGIGLNHGMRAIREVSKGMEPALLIQNWTHGGEVNLDDSFAGHD